MKKFATSCFGAILAIAATQSITCAADFSDPKKTIETCAKAIGNSDSNGIKACFSSNDADKQKQIDGIAQVMAAASNLKQASIEKFGNDGSSILATGVRRPGGDLAEKIQRLKDADEAIDGDTATLTAKVDANAPAGAPPSKPLYFKKIGGDWKIDWDRQTAPLPGAPAAHAGASAMMEDMSPLIAKAMNDTAAEVKAGKYASVDSAKMGLQSNMQTIFKSAFSAGGTGRGTSGQ